MGQVEWARELAARLLEEPLPQRWAHTQGVAAQAASLRRILAADADLVVAAAWLHDIGYAPHLVHTRLHPLDGARYLRDIVGADERLCRLVAHHTCAMVEAHERGLAEELTGEFEPEREDLADALIYCDMTIGPAGEKVTLEGRLRDILDRYEPDTVVHRAISRAAPELHAAVSRVQARLAAHG
ncbi:MAG: HD domain-containing protein [Carbonactinosporaceae bacterium]